MSEFPPDIITDILPRLPVKSLLRSRSVSKPWCSLIDNPDFIKIHLNRSIETDSNLTLVLGGWFLLYVVDFDTLDKASELEDQFKNSVVLGSCNGLLLLRKLKGRGNISLCNPLTRKYRVIPDSPRLYSFGSANPFEGTYALGYDSINDDYKIISIVEFKDGNRTWVGSETQIYSLKKNCWKRIKDFPYRVPFYRTWGVYVQGAFHGLVKQNLNSDRGDVILAIDFVAEDFRLMQLPDFPKNNLLGMTLNKLGKCLCLHGINRDAGDEIWVMKDYGVNGSWMKLLSVAVPDFEPLITLDILAYSKGCDKIMMNYAEWELVWYDLKQRTFIKIPVHDLPGEFHADVCVGSLVRLDVYGQRDENQGAKEQKKENKNNIKKEGFLSKGFKLQTKALRS